MTPAQDPRPDFWKKARHHARRLFILLCAAIILFAVFGLLYPSNRQGDLWNNFARVNDLILGLLCLVIGLVFALGAAYVILRLIGRGIIQTMDFLSSGRISPTALSWLTAAVLGVWGFVMFVLISMLIGSLGPFLFGRENFAGIFIQLILWLYFILFNPLALLVTIRYMQAKRQLAARLLLIQAAGLVNAGIDPIRALAQVEPNASYLDARQHAIAQALRRNLTFAQALNQSIPYLSSADRALLLAGERMGILGPVLTQKSDDLQREDKGSMSGFVPSVIVMEWSFLFIITLLIMIFIMPKYERIFEDFGSDLPLVTKTFMYISKSIMGTLPDQAIPGILYFLVILICIPFTLIVWPYIKATLGYMAVEAKLPVFSDMVIRSNLVDACFFLAHTLRAGIDLPTAVAQSRTLLLHRSVSARLLNWENDMRAGLDPGAAAQKAGLPPVMAAFIRAAQSGPAMGDAMDRLARYYRNQTSRSRIVLENLLMPAAIVVTGVVVGGLVIALFVPTARLITKLI